MVTLLPIPCALVPADAPAAHRLCGPNYDEFQSDREIVDLLCVQPDSVLQVTMPHCNVEGGGGFPEEGSRAALAVARERMDSLRGGPLTREVRDVIFIYEIEDPLRRGTRQMGLGGMAKVAEIRTEATPDAPIIRNEGIREEKAKGRADLIQATRSFVGIVNNAINDESREMAESMASYAAHRPCDYHARDEYSNVHRIWLIHDPGEQAEFFELLSREPCAYVADGNHRSAAAALLGSGEFLCVFFPARTMGLAPYNRLVDAAVLSSGELETALGRSFVVERWNEGGAYQPESVHEIGMYVRNAWYWLRPREDTFDPTNAAESIDSNIVQRLIFHDVFGIADARDKRLTFVGGNRDAAYLQDQVDAGTYAYAVTLAPVTMDQFISVCDQNRIMPPKSTWFQPKIRSGLVMALLGG